MGDKQANEETSGAPEAESQHVFDQTNGIVDLGEETPKGEDPATAERNRRRVEGSENMMMISYSSRL